eukprot:TRINITY_DN6373_c0_g1_i2.p1 TRINITY_DN6373_c0_g1~~TRINITY_DN6373_c0_g1_i2.p1  ORF type:complete len:439 (+),score=85.35 TRINITY_DN6373_c0_g1_i2:3-1319(+)
MERTHSSLRRIPSNPDPPLHVQQEDSFISRAHADAQASFAPGQAPECCLCMCANHWGCCERCCWAGPGRFRTGFCVPCDRTPNRALCEPCLCLASVVNPCWGLLWQECHHLCDTGGGYVITTGGWCSLLPPVGWLLGPCVISGMYQKAQDTLPNALPLPGIACELSGITFGVGAACCLFPCAVRQLKAEAALRQSSGGATPSQEDERRREFEAKAAAAYEADRKARHGSEVVYLRIVPGALRAVGSNGQALFSAELEAKVHPYQTVAEVLSANQAGWASEGCLDSEQWLRGLTGSEEHIMQAVMRRSGDESSVWVCTTVSGTTVVGELWAMAQANRKELVQEFGDAQMCLRIEEEQKGSSEVNVKACDLVAADFGVGAELSFSDVRLDGGSSWGAVWKRSGMTEGCEVQLRYGAQVDEECGPSSDESTKTLLLGTSEL